MKNNKFIKSTMILVIGGFITKLLGFIIRIIYTRIVGEEAISLYTIITPTYSLFVSIAAAFLPIAISKLVAENKKNSQKLLFNSFILICILDLILICLGLISSKYIATNLLKERRSITLIHAIIITIPFISASSLFKGYFLGKQKMHPNVISNIIEQVIRLLLIILVIPRFVTNIIKSVYALIIMSVITETVSCLVFISFLPKKTKLNISNMKLSASYIKDILKISIPLTSSRIIGNIGFFFEPILLTNLLLINGFSNRYILSNYGIYNAYAISLLALPNFFIMAISSAIIPEISKFYGKGNIKMVQKRFKQAIYLSLLLGIILSSFIFLFREELLLLIYKTAKGSNYIKILGPAFVLFYLEGPITSTLQAIGLSKETLKITIIGIIIKLGFMSILAFMRTGIYCLIIAEIINIFTVVLLSSLKIKKVLF